MTDIELFLLLVYSGARNLETEAQHTQVTNNVGRCSSIVFNSQSPSARGTRGLQAHLSDVD